MANFEINEDQAALIRELRKLETSDPVHANVYNALFEKLINNDAFLERLANKMIEKSMLCHVLDSVNAQQVLAADVGPKITAIIDGLQEDVNGLNTNKAANSDFTVGANYIIFKGFKICWGYNSIDLPGKTTTAYARQWNAFPITFSQARVFLTKAESTYDGNVTGMTVGNSFTNGFNIQARCTRDAGTNPTYSYSWLAVGK